MRSKVPAIAYVLGVAGVLPFILCGVAACLPGAQANFGILALVAYGASILSFVGAVHWGFALAPGEHGIASLKSVTFRLSAGVVPSLIGWCATLLAISALPEFALAGC
jgi:hypothetical protein